ncbi:ankyrin, partial [Coprinopsis marcescibilis]
MEDQGQKALMMAAKGGHGGIVSLLLQLDGVGYNRLDDLGRTPLMMAAQAADDVVVVLLLQLEGIKVDCWDNSGKTALAHAVSFGRVKTFEALL